jgi:UV DNA damage endonuclease
MELGARGVTSSKTMRLATLRTKAQESRETVNKFLDEISLANVDALAEVIEYNERLGIRFFRITSHVFPHMDNPEAEAICGRARDIEFAREALGRVGQLARGYGHRLTFHPDHYAQLGSPRADIVERTIADLNTHARIFRYMGYTPQLGSVMVFHGGGSYGDKAAALERWREGFLRLPPETRQFVALENDEFTYGIADLLPLCEREGIPLVIDVFHHSVMFPDTWQSLFDDRDTLDRIAAIWRRRGIVQKIHVSSQRVGARAGTHDDFIDAKAIRFDRIMRLVCHYGSDIMCECKFKEICAQRILDEFFVKSQHEDGRVYWSPRPEYLDG